MVTLSFTTLHRRRTSSDRNSVPMTTVMISSYLVFIVFVSVKWSAAWHSGRTFPILHLDYSWTGDHYVGKLSAIGQSPRPTQPFILLGLINE